MNAICHLCLDFCHFLRSAAVLVSCLLLSFPQLYAQTDNASKTLLIINSYNENSPWAKAMITPISYYMAQKDNVNVEIAYLNAALITDSIEYQRAKENALKAYDDEKIDYVVFIGNPAFTLRDEIKAKWDDIPMLLITRDLTNAPYNYYFSGFDHPIVDKSFPSVSELRPEYNFTTIFVPDLYKETIDMMVKLIPDMDELVFFSDAIYFNRYLSWDIENYLIAEYPNLKFKWVKASYENSDEFNSYMINKQPNKGLLLSSWFYVQNNALGYPELVAGDINLLYSSSNPVFSLRQGYMQMGAIGGVYTSIDAIKDAIIYDLEAMINNESMRDIKFYVNKEPRYAMLDYPLFRQFGFSERNCPDNVVFIGKPLTFWEKYHWQFIIAMLILAVIFFLLVRRSVSQRHKIEILSRNKQFVENMPIPYTKAKVLYNENMSAILNIKYTMTNQAFNDLIKENSDPNNSYVLFSSEFISERTSELLDNERPVSFLHHFKKSDKYYIFTLCLVDSKRRKDKDVVDTIDIFAIDITQRQKAEEDLKVITKRLDMTLDVADLIPWEWDMKTDVLTFDAQSVFQRLKRNLDSSHPDSERSVLSTAEFMKTIHPDDREVVRSVREKLYLDKVEKFEMQYRIIIARQNQEVVEWVEVKGAVAKRDDKGKPTLVMGSMVIITDRKRQEAERIEKERKSLEAETYRKNLMTKISHQLRTKLNDIVGFATLMSESDDAAKRKEYAQVISNDNNELLIYIDELAGEQHVGSKMLLDDVADSEAEAGKTDKAAPQPKVEDAKADAEKTVNLKASEKIVVAHGKEMKNAEEYAEQLVKDGKHPVILVAEDIEGNFLLLKHFIPKQYEIHHAWTGQEAVDLYHKVKPDMIMMDIGMPVMDGYKATAEIRKFSKDVPIVAVTAYTFASERDLIMNSGFDDYISKPVSREAISEALNRYL